MVDDPPSPRQGPAARPRLWSEIPHRFVQGDWPARATMAEEGVLGIELEEDLHVDDRLVFRDLSDVPTDALPGRLADTPWTATVRMRGDALGDPAVRAALERRTSVALSIIPTVTFRAQEARLLLSLEMERFYVGAFVAFPGALPVLTADPRVAGLLFPEDEYGPEALARLEPTHLELAAFYGSHIGPDGLSALVRGAPGLRQLYLTDNPGMKTEAELELLRGLPRLEELSIRAAPIPAGGFRRLRGFERLTYLDVGSTAFGDDDAFALGGLRSLSRIYVDRTPITEEGLRYLSALPHATVVTTR